MPRRQNAPHPPDAGALPQRVQPVIPNLPEHSMSIQTVGIIGAGTMGNGIAQACAVAGLNVVMIDVAEAALAKGVANVAGNLDRLIKKDKLSAAQKDAALALITTSTEHAALVGAQIVIEAATENEALKVKILQQLDGLLAPEVIVATNTSSISITKLAAATQRADRFIGMHFFNPVPLMALVEIIRGLQTSDATPPSRRWPSAWARRRSA
jgi:3-hydroxybutyryl-CoA dehydrogenase